VFLMSNITTTSTIAKLRHLFSIFGVPETIVSDNGTQFASHQFGEFVRHFGITHVTSPPFHPQSNGQAERFVDTFKRALTKSRGEGTTAEVLDLFLLNYRATPNPQSPDGRSPAEVMLNRRLRLPHDAIRPPSSHPQPVTERNPAFQPGSRVLVRDYRFGHHKWCVGVIIERIGQVIYTVRVGSRVWRRHANQLRPTQCSLPPTTECPLDLDLLLETFDLPKKTPTTTAAATPSTPSTPDPALQPRRWTDRARKPVVPLQLDPRRQSYTGQPKGGGARMVKFLENTEYPQEHSRNSRTYHKWTPTPTDSPVRPNRGSDWLRKQPIRKNRRN
jgi:hypothetical protein